MSCRPQTLVDSQLHADAKRPLVCAECLVFPRHVCVHLRSTRAALLNTEQPDMPLLPKPL